MDRVCVVHVLRQSADWNRADPVQPSGLGVGGVKIVLVFGWMLSDNSRMRNCGFVSCHSKVLLSQAASKLCLYA